jgi:O-antigen ligase
MIKDHPFAGIGPGNFQEVFLKYYKLGWGTGTKYVHNIFLQLWVETGILGPLGMISLIIVFITKNTVKSNYIFLAGLVFLFHNLIDLTYFIPEAGLFWWIIIGLACHEPELKRY